MILRWPSRYGSSLTISRGGVWLMLNGRMFSFYRSLHTGKWKWSLWDNIWRKTKTRLERRTASS